MKKDIKKKRPVEVIILHIEQDDLKYNFMDCSLDNMEFMEFEKFKTELMDICWERGLHVSEVEVLSIPINSGEVSRSMAGKKKGKGKGKGKKSKPATAPCNQ